MNRSGLGSIGEMAADMALMLHVSDGHGGEFDCCAKPSCACRRDVLLGRRTYYPTTSELAAMGELERTSDTGSLASEPE